MMSMITDSVSFVKVGLLARTLVRFAQGKRRWPRRPVLGADVPLPWASFEDHRCFGCSAHNEPGLKLRFQEADGWDLACVWRPDEHLTNYPGMVHGGIAVTVLDELVGQAIFHRA